MAVAVDIPTRVRVDASALRGRTREIEDALHSAGGRALVASRDAVLADTTGRPAELRLAAPRFAWTGPGAAGVSDELREEVEWRLFGALVDAVSAAGLEAGAPLGRGARERGAPFEPIDPNRHAPLLGRYVIPSYATAGAEAIPIEGGGIDAGAPAPSVAFAVVREEEWLQASRALDSWLSAHPVAPGTVRLVGVIGALQEGQGFGIHLYRCRGLPGGGAYVDWLYWFWVKPVRRRLRDADDFEDEPLGLPADVPLAFAWVSGDPAAPAFQATLREDWKSIVAANVAAERAKLLGPMSDEAVARREERLLTKLAERDKGTRGLGRLEVGRASLLIRFGEPLQGLTGTVPLVPFVAAPGIGPEAPPAEKGKDKPADEGKQQAAAEGEEEPAAEGKEEPAAEEELVFPADGGPEQLMCAAFEDEPPVSKLGADGERLWRLMAAIGERLQIVPCDYAGGFALMAAEALAGRASDVGRFSVTAEKAFLRPRPAGDGNLGYTEFEAAPSAAIQFMRHLARVVPALHELQDATIAVYRRPEHAAQFPPRLHPGSWRLHFAEALGPRIKWAVAVLFGMTCRILLLQLLRASHDAIRGRQQNIGVYSALFEDLILPRLRRVGELIELRERLQEARRPDPHRLLVDVHVRSLPASIRPPRPTPAGPSEAELAQQAWVDARDALLDTLGPATAPPQRAADPRAGELLMGRDGLPEAIRDREGRPWTLAALERGIAMRRGFAEELDPLVKQLGELPEVFDRFRSGNVSLRLALLLHEMATANEHQQHLVAQDWTYAVKASAINRSLRHETLPLAGYQLGAIHMLAHEAIGDAFEGDVLYALGIRGLFHTVLGREGILNFIEFTGTVLLAVLCPPLGFAVGLASAGAQYQRASERAELYRALIDPELVLTRAEVETELFLARLGVALSLIPALGPLLRIGRSAAGVGVRYGAGALTRAAPRFAVVLARSWVQEVQQTLRRGLVVALAKELLEDVVTDAIAERILEPIVAQMERELAVAGPVGGVTGVVGVLERLRREHERAGARP